MNVDAKNNFDKNSPSGLSNSKKNDGKTTEKKGFKQGNRKRGRRGQRFGNKKSAEVFGQGSRNINKGLRFNDVRYYNKNKAITEAFAKLPFNYIIGNRVTNAYNQPYISNMFTMLVDWLSSATHGSTVASKSILNKVATILYTQMRRSNAGATNGIEYVDPITSNLLAGIDILINGVCAHRVFSIANTFSWKNRLQPKLAFQALGIDYADFIANQANYRGRFDNIVAQARTIKVLKDFDFINAICDEFAHIFKDSDTDTGREQLYMNIKPVHHIYDAKGTAQFPGGCVRLINLQDLGVGGSDASKRVVFTIGKGYINTVRKFSMDLDIMQKQIDALINDADFNLTQADIEKAFGEQGVYSVVDALTEIAPTISYEYSGEYLTMLHNATIYPAPQFNTWNTGGVAYTNNNHYHNEIYQTHDIDGSVRLTTQMFYIPATAGLDDPARNYVLTGKPMMLLDSEQNDPTTDDVIIMTRYKNFMEVSTAADLHDLSGYLGDTNDLPSVSDISAYGVVGGKVTSNFFVFGGMMHALAETEDGETEYALPYNNVYPVQLNMSLDVWTKTMSGFKDAPLSYFIDTSDIDRDTPIYLIGDYNNIRGISDTELIGIHESCFLSLWNLPQYDSI